MHIDDGIDLVVPRDTVDPADFRGHDGDLLPRIAELHARGRPGSALAMCRSAAFEAFRRGERAEGARLREAMDPLYAALGRSWR